MRPYGLTLAATLAALAIGYWAGRSNSPTAATASATQTQGAVATISHKPAGSNSGAAKPASARQLNTAVSGVTAAAPRTSAPLPAPGAPLKDTRAELAARAEAGDAEAASRLFRDTQRCADVRRVNSMVPRMAQRALDQKADGLSPEAARGREKMFAEFDKQLNFVRDNAVLCEGLSDDEINQVLPNAMQAALLGDTVAADCYVGTGMYGMPQGLLDHPEWLADYKQNAVAIANAAIDRGDWAMVSMLSNAYDPNFFVSLLGQVTGRDPVQAYRLLKLRTLGATGGRAADFVNRELAMIGNEIPADAKAAGDAWAQQTFQTAFGSTPPTPPNGGGLNFTNACHSDAL